MTAQSGVLELFLNGVWTVVPLYSAAGTTITRGVDSEGSWPRPTKVECEINNDTLNYDPSRPESTLYGVAGRNTKARYSSNGNMRVWAEASSWRPDRTPEHVPGLAKGRAWTVLVAEGLLRRIGMWTDPLRSPMYRTISGRSISLGHWSIEEEQSALRLANSAAGGTAGLFKGGVTLGETDRPLGAEQTAKMVIGGQLAGQFLTASVTAGWVVAYSFRLPALPGSAVYGELFRWSTTVGYTYIIEVNNTTYQVRVLLPDGTALYTSGGIAFGAGAEPNQWVTFRIKAFQSGGNVQIEPAWYAQGANVTWGATATFAGTVGGLRQWWINGSAANDQGHYSHVHAVTGVADDLLSFAVAIPSFNGYIGETALDRFGRLCSELGITRYMIGSGSDTQRMGPQQAATFLELLREIRETDDCRIDDERFDIALTLTTRRALYNQTPALSLTYPSQVAVPFSRILDDLNTHNRVTVKNAAGGDVTSSLTVGRMSTQPPPAGVGEYKSTVEVSVQNPATQLQDLADWWRAKGTLERPRYAEVTVDLLADPGLIGAAMAVREGNMVQVAGAEAETVRLLVVGIVERVGAVEWTITFQVELYDPYMIGVWDDPGSPPSRWDTASTTMAAGATSVATALSLTTVDVNDVLTTAGASIPYDLMIDGERVRVTAMTAAAGAGPYTQTATVTRSVNGVVKAQLSGARVSVADARRWGL